MRKLTAGNKSRFTMFVMVIIIIIAILIIFLNKVLNFEKEEYQVTKDVFIYDKNYEHIELIGDAIIEKKWTGEYYLNEPETGLSYDLGHNSIAYDSIKNKISLYGTFYEVALDGEVTKTVKNTEISDMYNSRLYKIEDRKYLLVASQIITENSSLVAEDYLIVVIDKSGNTLLLNDEMDVKTINAIVLETDTFKFDVANEKLLYNETQIDLTKIIGSTNEYVEVEKVEENEDKNNEGQVQVGGTNVNVGGSSANSSYSPNVNVGGTTVINPGGSSNSNNGNTNIGNSNNNNNNHNNNNGTVIGGSEENKTPVSKSANLRSIVPGTSYLDVNYIITDPENKYQVVYLTVEGGGIVDTVSLDKTSNFYRITGLNANTDYTVTLGYKEIKNDNTVEEVTEDVLNVRTEKLGGSFSITKVTPNKIYFNLKLDPNSEYDNAKIVVLINGNETDEIIEVDTNQALLDAGWNYSIDRTDKYVGKITLKLTDVKDVELTTSTQIY